jgi:2-polyprenyl-3-methyl-5-hydroxy-6-metoxy-1,4-benzoquinol methylase
VGSIGGEGAAGEYSRRGNLQKYESRNPVQRLLIWYFHRRVWDLVVGTGAGRILDVGCGEGFTVGRLLAQDGHLAMQGLDADWPALLQAKRSHPGPPFLLGDIARLPYANDSFDLVLCLEVLEHLGDHTAALDELKRVSGRYCLISVPNEPWFMLANLLRGKNVRAWGNDPEHVQHWTAGGFRRMMGEYFTVERVVYPFPWVLALCQK